MNKYLKVPTHNPNVCIRILQLNTANPFRRSVMAGPSLLQPPPCRGGVISVHHDPVHGIVTNPGNREWEPFPLSFFVVCAYPVHRVMVNWDPPISQYLGLPGGKQKGNHSNSMMLCVYRYSILYCNSTLYLMRDVIDRHENMRCISM